MENQEYILFPVSAGTILIDASLCDEDASTGRLRFTWLVRRMRMACLDT